MSRNQRTSIFRPLYAIFRCIAPDLPGLFLVHVDVIFSPMCALYIVYLVPCLFLEWVCVSLYIVICTVYFQSNIRTLPLFLVQYALFLEHFQSKAGLIFSPMAAYFQTKTRFQTRFYLVLQLYSVNFFQNVVGLCARISYYIRVIRKNMIMFVSWMVTLIAIIAIIFYHESRKK